MQHLSIQLSALSPLAIRSDHAPGGAGAASYIPGTTFVGALAAAHRLLRSDKTEEFERWFLSGEISYPNLYPATFDDEGLQDRNLPVYPVPRTAQTCKRHPGFLFPEKEENDAHGVRDSLIDWALFELSRLEAYNDGGKADPLAALEAQKKCSHCDQRMDSFRGYYRRNDIDPGQLIVAKEHRRLQTHSGIDRRSGTVQEGILYNRQVFEEGMRFWGMVQFPDDEHLISAFTKFIDELRDKKAGNEGLLRVGTGRTRGMGRVAIDLEQIADEQNPFETFQQRLEHFNRLVHTRAEDCGLKNLEKTFFFALTLHAPLILRDEFLRYRGNIDPFTLEEELLHCSVPGLERIYQNARIRRMSGWQEIWGLPRTNEYAMEAGSIFLFACSSQPDDAVYRALFTLEERGAGQRRAEGFGQVRVSDQFHQEIKAL